MRILNADGYGLLSWYVCGLDWILAQRDPNDSSPAAHRGRQHERGEGRLATTRNCGAPTTTSSTGDLPPRRGRASRSWPRRPTTHASARAARPGGLQRGHHRLGPRRHGRQARRPRRQPLLLVGRLRQGRHVRRLQQLRRRRGPHRAGQVHLVDEARERLRVHRRGRPWPPRPSTGAVALYKASRPNATPAEVKEALQYLGNLDWKTSTDPDAYHEKLLDVSRLGPLGTFDLDTSALGYTTGEAGGTSHIPVAIARSTHLLRARPLHRHSLPSGWSASLGTASLLGWTADRTTISVKVPGPVAVGDVSRRGRAPRTRAGPRPGPSTVVVESDKPTGRRPSASCAPGASTRPPCRSRSPGRPAPTAPAASAATSSRPASTAAPGAPHLGERQHPHADSLAAVRAFDRPARPGPRQRRQLRRLGPDREPGPAVRGRRPQRRGRLHRLVVEDRQLGGLRPLAALGQVHRRDGLVYVHRPRRASGLPDREARRKRGRLRRRRAREDGPQPARNGHPWPAGPLRHPLGYGTHTITVRTRSLCSSSSTGSSRSADRSNLRVARGSAPAVTPLRCVRLRRGPRLATVRYRDVPASRSGPWARRREAEVLPWRERCGKGPSSSGWSPSRSSSISRPNPRASASTCSTRTTCRGSR